MTDPMMNTEQNQEPEKENEELEHPAGFTDLTGPAAFKAQSQKEKSDQDAENEKTAKLEQTLAETRDQLLRTVADMDNLRKRAIREREDAAKYAVSGFARDLMDVADTFRRALDSIPDEVKSDERAFSVIEGLHAMERALLFCFEKNGLKKLEPLDEVFNPNFHEVMFETPMPDKINGTIIQIIEPGYLLHDRLLRPARVGVAKSDRPNAHNVDTNA